MYPHITYSLLFKNNACSKQLALFKKHFGKIKPIPLTREVATKFGNVFDIRWAAHTLLTKKDFTEYLKATNPALAEYNKVTAPAMAEYKKITALAQEEYIKTDSALKEFEKVTAPAYAKYKKVTNSAFTKYNKVIATTFVEIYKKGLI